MKKFLGTCIVILFTNVTLAQYSIKGKVILENSKQPVEAATITLLIDETELVSQSTSDDGSFLFNVKSKGTYQLRAQHVGLENKSFPIEVVNPVTIADISLLSRSYFLEPLEIKSLRASDRAPFAKTNINKQQIEKYNSGQDLPFLLNQTPGVVVNSDAGNGIGYTGIRIRGSDATRINVTVNGIPYNDAESQGTFFVDMPDIASSVNSIQIQRGVGTSSNGAGAFGASINISTNEFIDKPYAEINNSYGSFNSWKNTLKVGSGLLSDHFTIDARLSRISSDGFIDRASSDLKSLFLSTAYVNTKSSLRFNYISGYEKTYQAWYGIPQDFLRTNRIHNMAGTEKPGEPYNNETDNYWQDHYQLLFNHSFNTTLSFNTAVFLVKGRGFYEQYKADASYSDYGLEDPEINGSPISTTDLVRQLWLDNNYYGQIFSFQYKKNKQQLTFGGGWNRYDGKHFGEIIWATAGIPKNHRWYDLDALKTDANAYAKMQYEITPQLSGFADVQYRHVNYTMNGFRNNPLINVTRKFDFINPKIGISYSHNNSISFVSFAVANKEPNRDDFEAGIAQQPKHETLYDFEAGYQKKNTYFSWGTTAYYMLYKNQLILTGQINDVGAYTRENVPDSYRMGLELEGKATITKWLNAAGNVAISKNKIKTSAEYLDDYDNGGQKIIHHSNTNISYSPDLVAGLTVNLLPVKNGEISLINKYVSRQYLDNTENIDRSLRAFFVQDVRLSYSIRNKIVKELNLVGTVYNVFNRMYEPNGYTFSYIYDNKTTTENYYFPMAGINYMVGINIKL